LATIDPNVVALRFEPTHAVSVPDGLV